MPTVYYHLSHYISHAKAGRMNMLALAAAGIPLTDDPCAADSVIIHQDPMLYGDILAQYPQWRSVRKIAYAVWENPVLPPAYTEALQGVDSVWTCSHYAQQALLQAGKPVHVVPHVVCPTEASADDLARMAARLYGTQRQGQPCPARSPIAGSPPDSRPGPPTEGALFFYTIADSYNPRKNLMGLLEAFSTHMPRCKNAYLVVKQYRKGLDLSGLPRVISISDNLSEGELAALHQLCHCYVSAHHSEAWGLSLSDAMACGNPVIATGYSGNMEFMHAGNSFPVDYTMARVPPLMCQLLPLFSPDMEWAEPDIRHMGYLMGKVARHYPCAELSAAARESMRAYSPELVGQRMRELLLDCAEG